MLDIESSFTTYSLLIIEIWKKRKAICNIGQVHWILRFCIASGIEHQYHYQYHITYTQKSTIKSNCEWEGKEKAIEWKERNVWLVTWNRESRHFFSNLIWIPEQPFKRLWMQILLWKKCIEQFFRHFVTNNSTLAVIFEKRNSNNK